MRRRTGAGVTELFPFQDHPAPPEPPLPPHPNELPTGTQPCLPGADPDPLEPPPGQPAGFLAPAGLILPGKKLPRQPLVCSLQDAALIAFEPPQILRPKTCVTNAPDSCRPCVASPVISERCSLAARGS